jgi:cytochrome P450
MGGFCLVDLFPSSRLVRWLSNDERRMKNSCSVIERIITDIVIKRKAVRAARDGGTWGTDDEDLLDMLLKLQEEDSLASPLTTENITTVLFVSFHSPSHSDLMSTTLGVLLSHPQIPSFLGHVWRWHRDHNNLFGVGYVGTSKSSRSYG